jgi:hypothetical protein
VTQSEGPKFKPQHCKKKKRKTFKKLKDKHYVRKRTVKIYQIKEGINRKQTYNKINSSRSEEWLKL